MPSLDTNSKPLRWRIRFTDGKHVAVHVWADREEYEAALAGAGEELAGSYACFKASPVRVNSRKVGEIHLVTGKYGAGVVAHECLHAVFHWLDFIPSGDTFIEMAESFANEIDDETLCRELGTLVSEFWIGHGEETVKL